ncbi:MAG: flippase-like domain-containing protein [Clostridia bacterium]|nr:flippase-like domain-containing protein [Clostridia bacterium]
MNEYNGGIDGGGKKPSGRPSFSFKRNLIWVLLLLVLTAAVVILLNHCTGLTLRGFFDSLKHISLPYVLCAILALAGYVFCEGRAMASVGAVIGAPMGPVRSTLVSSTELFFSAITPSASGGQPAAAFFLTRGGTPLPKATVILINNTLHYMLSLIVMGTAAVALSFPFVSALSPVLKILLAFGFLLNLLAFSVCLLLLCRRELVRKICFPAIRFLSRIRLIRRREAAEQRLERAMAEYADCQKMIRGTPAAQAKIFLWNLLQRLCSFSIAYFVYRAFGFSAHGLVEVLCLQTFSALAVNGLPLPGGTGAAEFVFLELYRGYYPPGLAAEAMLLTRAISFYCIFFFCGIVSVGYYLYFLKKERIGKRI